jgi:folylpolyglutamate synthase
VTLIDYDHVRVLGSTLERIAWEKGGVYVRDKTTNIGPDDGGYDEFVARGGCCRVDGRRRRPKEGEAKEEEMGKLSSIVFASGTNTPEVLTVLDNIAESNGSRLSVVRDDDGDGSSNSYPTFLGDVGLSGDHQKGNAALALAMCRYAARRRPDLMARRSSSSSLAAAAAGTTTELEDDNVRRALATSFWPGRCHTVHLADATLGPVSLDFGKAGWRASDWRLPRRRRTRGRWVPGMITTTARLS